MVSEKLGFLPQQFTHRQSSAIITDYSFCDKVYRHIAYPIICDGVLSGYKVSVETYTVDEYLNFIHVPDYDKSLLFR